MRGVLVKEWEVEMVGEECEVYCEDGRRRVARGLGRGENVGCSIECDMEW